MSGSGTLASKRVDFCAYLIIQSLFKVLFRVTLALHKLNSLI